MAAPSALLFQDATPRGPEVAADGCAAAHAVAALGQMIGLLLEALERSEERYRGLLASAPDGIFRVDRNGRILELNPASESILGRSADEVIGAHFHTLLAEEDRDLAVVSFRDVLDGSVARDEIELRVARPSGERRLVRVSRSVVTEGGEVVAVRGVARDVTEERARELQLRRAERMASITPMLSGVCHELNNPLTSIKSFAELMLLDERPEEDREALEIVQREAHRAAKIVSDLRTVARQSQEAGTGRGEIQLNDLIREVLSRRAPALARAGIELREDLAPDLPAIWASAPEIEQVIYQLVTNAEHALQEQAGPRLLTVRSFPGDIGVAAAVVDNGPGIAAQDIGRIFDPFWTTRSPGEGTGLGLSLAHTIVSEHGGRIRVDSEAGRGAAFTLELPSAPDTLPALGDCQTESPASHGLRILVVDDEAPIRFSLARYMERRGHLVREASEGRAALSLLQESTNAPAFDIIVADLRMPGLDGPQLLERLRQRGDGLDQRLIFITGDADCPEAERLLRDAGLPVVWKPFELAEVAQIIESQAGMVASVS
jgi:two-component system NtrC family sensor kinase